MKSFKLIPLLLATSLLASCSGSGSTLSPKEFLDEGKVVTYKDGVLGYVQAVKDANYEQWTVHNFAIKRSNNMKEVHDRSYSKLDAKFKSTSDMKNGSENFYDPTVKVVKRNVYRTELFNSEGTYYDEDSREIRDGTSSSSDVSQEEFYYFIDGTNVVEAIPNLKVYTETPLTGFDFDKYIENEYTQMLAPILVYYQDFSSLPITTTEEGYKAAVEKAFSIDTTKGDSITISLNKNVITFNYKIVSSYEMKNYKSETTKDAKMQLVLDQNKSVFNYKYHEVKKDTINLQGFDDCKLYDVRTTDYHFSSWAEDSGSLNKPDVSKYTRYESE